MTGLLDAMTAKEIGAYPDVGWTNMDDTPEVQQFLNNLPHNLRVRIEELRQKLEASGQLDLFQEFINKLMISEK